MQTFGANKKGSISTYITMCLVIAAAGSLFNPVLSLYLNTELGFDPLHISIFFVLLPIATIAIVQTVAKFSDMGLQRPAIICIASLFGVASAVILYFRPSYLFLCTLGLICLASYPVSFPQIFASAREYSIKYVHGSIMFTTFLRSLASLSWVVGPPLAYTIVIGFSFDMLFLVAGLMFLACSVTSFFFLPNVLDKSAYDKSNHIKWWTNRSIIILSLSFACLFTAFSSYLTSVPLFVTQELKLDSDLPGYIMGLAAFLEIPIMFVAARLAKSIGLKPIVIIGAICLVIYLAFLHFVDSKEHILYLQIFPALFIGLLATMGMVMFQELLPQIPGQATSLYINSSTAGQIIGGALISLAASGSYRAIYEVGFVIAILGVLLLFFVKKPPKVH